MAKSTATGLPKPQEFQNSKGIMGIYIPGVCSSIGEIEEMFEDAENNIRDSNKQMKYTIAKCKPHDFQHMRVPFPVETLQHVTVRSRLHEIIRLEGFIPSRHKRTTRPDFGDLLFCSAEISEHDIEKGRHRVNDNLKSVITPEDERKFNGEIQKQFASSPAFKASASRYGQYKFSFPLSLLLTWYGSQFCQGKAPQLRILGTNVYKMEIAHYIVVHSPDTAQFDDLPVVPTVQSEEDSQGFVYWMNGMIYWRPEATSYLYVKILKDGSVRKECYNRACPYMSTGRCLHVKDGIYGPWNYLGFTFHIPPVQQLKIPRDKLLETLTACDTDIPYLGKEYDHNPSDIIEEIRNKWRLEGSD